VPMDCVVPARRLISFQDETSLIKHRVFGWRDICDRGQFN
jgi:hypothetical protein